MSIKTRETLVAREAPETPEARKNPEASDACKSPETREVSELSDAPKARDVLIRASDKSARELFDYHAFVDSAQNTKDGIALETLIAKSNVTSIASKNSFSMYSYTASLCEGTTDAFFQNMPTFPFFKKFSTDGAYEYAFFELAEDACGQFITVTLFSFKRDITSTDFMVALQALGITEIPDTILGVESISDRDIIGGEIMADELNALPSEGAFGADITFNGTDVNGLNLEVSELSAQLKIQDAACTKDDSKHLQKLVHAVISLYLGGITIDIFRSTKTDDYMVFSSYLTYMWYRFSFDAGNVRLGTCELCGRGFSLAGARGKKRRYCSESCKDKAKNSRNKNRTDKIRAMYMSSGASLNEIACAIFGCVALDADSGIARPITRKQADAQNRIQSVLRSCPALKQTIRAEIRDRSGGVFARRCIKDGIFTADEIIEIAKNINRLK